MLFYIILHSLQPLLSAYLMSWSSLSLENTRALVRYSVPGEFYLWSVCFVFSFSLSLSLSVCLRFHVFPFDSTFSICHLCVLDVVMLLLFLEKQSVEKKELSGLITWNILFYFHKFRAAYGFLFIRSFVGSFRLCSFLCYSPFAFANKQLFAWSSWFAVFLRENGYMFSPFRSICFFCFYCCFCCHCCCWSHRRHHSTYYFILAYFTFLHNI